MPLPPTFWGEAPPSSASSTLPSSLDPSFKAEGAPPELHGHGQQFVETVEKIFPAAKFHRTFGAVEARVGILGLVFKLRERSSKAGDSRWGWTADWEVAWTPQSRYGEPTATEMRRLGSLTIKRPESVGGWLSMVYTKMMEMHCNTLRDQVHPDDFLADKRKAKLAAQQLALMQVSDAEVVRLIAPTMPWKRPEGAAERYSVVLLYRAGFAGKERAGTVGLGRKDRWRYGVSLTKDYLSAEFTSTQHFSARETAPLSVIPFHNTDLAKRAAERFYALSVYRWLTNA